MNRIHHVLRSTLPVAALACAAFLLAGCGDKHGVAAPKPAAKPKPATAPTADPTLTKQVGKQLAPLVAAGCKYGRYTEEDALHVQSASELKWKTFPPASGTHFPQWADFGWYTTPVNSGYVVHDMEHGGVSIWRGKGLTTAQSAALEKLLAKGEKWISVPQPDLDGLAVDAWAKSLSCSSAALTKLDAAVLAKAVDAWYHAVQSTGSVSEKDLPPYHGGLSDPTPQKNISIAAPF